MDRAFFIYAQGVFMKRKSRKNIRMLQIYDITAYNKFLKSCRLDCTNVTRRLNEFIQSEAAAAEEVRDGRKK